MKEEQIKEEIMKECNRCSNNDNSGKMKYLHGAKKMLLLLAGKGLMDSYQATIIFNSLKKEFDRIVDITRSEINQS